MVAVLHTAPRAAAPQAVAAWLESLAPRYSETERAALSSAFDLAHERVGDARMPDGEAALDRAVGAATIVASLELDPDTIASALLIGLPVAGAFDADEIAKRFSPDVATVVAGVARMSSIRARPESTTKEGHAAQAENLRKMLLAMVEDI
jgi:(p)ppGpp synthase/HD superfamily hydrolase